MDLKHYADLGEEYVAACLGEEELSHGTFRSVDDVVNERKAEDMERKSGGKIMFKNNNAYPSTIRISQHRTALTFKNVNSRGRGIYVCPNGCTAQIEYKKISNGDISYTYDVVYKQLKSDCPHVKYVSKILA